MKDTYLMIRKIADGKAAVISCGTGADLAGLAVSGVRQMKKEFPEHAKDIADMLERDADTREGFAYKLMKWVCLALMAIGLVVVVLAVGNGLSLIGLRVAHWLEQAEAAVTAWLISW